MEQHANGVQSTAEATPGALVSGIIIYLAQKWGHPIDPNLAGAVVGFGALVSSYIMGWFRKPKGSSM